MAGRRGNVRIKIDADDNTRSGVTSAERNMSRLSAVSGKMGHAVKTGAVLAGAGLLALGEGAKKSVEDVEDLGKSTVKLSRITGLDTKTASEWVQQAKVRGISTQQLSVSFVAYAKQLTAAKKGTDASVAAFKKLGLSQDQIKKGNFKSTLAAVSDGLKKIPDGAQKAALAQQLFGKQAQNLMPLLNQGSDALKEQLDTVDKYGAAIGGKTVEQVKKSAEEQRNLKLAFEGIKVTVGTALLPIFDKLLQLFSRIVAGVRTGKGEFGSLHGVLVTVGSTVKSVAGFFAPLASAILHNKTALVALIAVFAGFKVVRMFAAAMAALDLVMDANPITLVVTAIAALGAALVLAYKKSATFREVVDTAFKVIKTEAQIWWNVLKAVFNALVDAFKFAWNAAKKFGSIVGDVWDGLKSVAASYVQFLKDRLSDILWVYQKILEGASYLPLVGGKFKKAAEGIQAFRDQLEGAKSDAEQLPGIFAQVASAAQNAAVQMANANRQNPHGSRAPQYRSSGGPIGGYGGGDVVPAMLEPGEFVVRKEAVARVGHGFMALLNSGNLPGFSTGGTVKKKKTKASRFDPASRPDNSGGDSDSTAYTNYQAALDKVDLEERAGILTPEQARQRRINLAKWALSKKHPLFGQLKGNEGLQILGDERDAEASTTDDSSTSGTGTDDTGQQLVDLVKQLVDLQTTKNGELQRALAGANAQYPAFMVAMRDWFNESFGGDLATSRGLPGVAARY